MKKKDKEYEKLTNFLKDRNCSKCINLSSASQDNFYAKCEFPTTSGYIFMDSAEKMVCSLFEKREGK